MKASVSMKWLAGAQSVPIQQRNNMSGPSDVVKAVIYWTSAT